MLKSKSLPILAGAAALGLLVGSHEAAAVTFDFTSCHITGGCGGPGPYGTVMLTQNGTTVDVDVHVAPNEFILSGSGDMNYFKFDATGVLLTDITVDSVPNHVLGAQGSSAAALLDGDGTGLFNFGIICVSGSCGNGSGAGFTNDIVFHVASATIADLTIANNLG